ncbi:Do family serine endopeptidase [Sphingomonas prati]|uniref:Probable periplasmic serine endoprotease DegP-like n=1 Tax=Sphingomonas prati TaxID=1843237 RepID=A0A7W9F0K4_9SPHN|nr:Do family serine endopeptidase [Sphingomonas prati]MBB5728477.1 serine protease Do [Sphingomonas prati]GGE73466.1 serine protease [Sphingomonas prati]
MRYAYAITAAMLAGGATATLVVNQPLGAQVAQNAPGTVPAVAPRPGAPMSFADLAAKLQPAVVNISTTQQVSLRGNQSNPFAGSPFEDFFKQFGGQGGAPGDGGRPQTREATSLGSGFIVSDDGYIVTNNHVISGGRDAAGQGTTSVVSSITVTLPDRKEYVAKVVGRDVNSDLAVLKIEARGLPFVQFGDSKRARIGDWVVAIGNPFGLGSTVTAGIVSALHRGIGTGSANDRYIQTDASINQGNSGGPMFDLNGNVIGINTAIYSPTGGNVGIGFAIPAEEAKPIVDALRAGKRVRRGYLGVGIQPIDDNIAESLGLPKNVGELIRSVEPGYAAARAGIRQGDVVVKIGGTEITPDSTLSYTVANLPIGSRVPIELIRNGQRTTVTAVIGERPPEDQLASAGSGQGLNDDDDSDPSTPQAQPTRASLGLSLQALTPEIGRSIGLPTGVRGVVISAVDPSSNAASQGLARGDVILSINQKPTTTIQEVIAAVNAAKAAGRPSVLMLVQRQATPPRYLGVELAKK